MILAISKLDPNKRIRELTSDEFDRLRKAIERIEGWEVGREDFIERWYILGVHKKHGIITEYLIDKKGENIWIAKEEAVQWTEEGKLHAIVVHQKNGHSYLRLEHANQSFTLIV
ncbi:MAG TPA: hypothetical protein PKW79_05505 [Rhabdochlamydiaceae bacterium]|jgi:ribosomal protein S13|nr:hypothetical protein [Rhabdochlamydiaceae bacterium]